jgi:plastocyanin
VALAAGRGASAGVSPEVLATLPSLTGRNYMFSQREIRVKAGETVALRLENADPEAHVFEIDELSVHAPMLAGQTGVALFRPLRSGAYTFYCTPHFNKATGEGMKGTLIVEP